MILHEFNMSDVEDPYLFAAEPLYKWEKSDQGQFAMSRVKQQPVFHCYPDMHRYGYRVVVTGEFADEKDELIYKLKYGFSGTDN